MKRWLMLLLALLMLGALLLLLWRSAPRPPATVVDAARVYWVRMHDAQTLALAEALRPLPAGGVHEQARAWIEMLAAGPSEAERAQGYASEIPADTRLLGVSLQDGVLTVRLSEAVAAGGGSASMQGRLQQLRHSLTSLPGVSALVVEVGAEPLRVWGGEGIVVAWPWLAGSERAEDVRW